MEKLDKVVLNKKGEEYALENIKANRLSKIIKKAIMGLTLAGGLILTGCGEKEVVPDIDIGHGTYPGTVKEAESAIVHEYERTYGTKVTERERKYLEDAVDWYMRIDCRQTLYGMEDTPQNTMQMDNNNRSFCIGILKLVEEAKTVIIEDALSANEIPGGSYIKPEDCQIRYDASTQQYYIEASVKNAFSDDSMVYYTLVEDEELKGKLDYISMVSTTITDEDISIYGDVPTFAESSKKYEEVIVPLGVETANILINSLHKDYNFSKWEVKESENIYSKK